MKKLFTLFVGLSLALFSLQAQNNALLFDGVDDYVLYPNPTNELLNLSCEEGIQNISITNLTGKTVWSGSAFEFPLNVTSFAKGIYLVNIVSASGMKTEKVIIK